MEADMNIAVSNDNLSTATKVDTVMKKDKAFSLETKRADFVAALALLNNVVERRNTIPILSNVRISNRRNSIVIEGTDLDVVMKIEVPRIGNSLKVDTTLLHGALLNFLKSSTSDNVTISGEPGNKVFVQAGASMKTDQLPASDWPTFPTSFKTPVKFSVSALDLKSALDAVAPAISIEETRYYLNGIYFEPCGLNELKMTATDGHRLHSKKIAVEGMGYGEKLDRIIVPRKTVHAVQKLCDALLKTWKKDKSAASALNCMIDVCFGTGRIDFRCGTTEIISKGIDGTFPDYNRVIPTGNDKTATFISAALDATIKRVAANSGKSGHAYALKFSLVQNNCTLSVCNHDTGDVSEMIDTRYDHDPMDIGFHPPYVRDAIKVLGTDTVEFVLADPGTPTIIRSDQNADLMVVIMPKRV
jgi:DNA polymerase-3 subunit beta